MVVVVKVGGGEVDFGTWAEAQALSGFKVDVVLVDAGGDAGGEAFKVGWGGSDDVVGAFGELLVWGGGEVEEDLSWMDGDEFFGQGTGCERGPWSLEV